MSPNTQRALITGATAGLGAEFAQQLAAKHYQLVLVARNTERLEAKAVRLRQDFGVEVEVISADLQDQRGIDLVVKRLERTVQPVTTLVNNAGFGLTKSFEENTVQEESDHLQLLVTTPMLLMHAAIPGMLARGEGKIINVASVAGFIPRASYGACKAWLISFSRWANVHYSARGVGVTAVCPGFVHTEFHQRMNASTSGIPNWMWLNPDRVVREGLADAAAGKSVSVPSKRYKALTFFSKFSSDKLGAFAGKRGR
ncbi:SDR family NAD(P)-dependent oxidoreductase [Psychromicrobium lacuslunae]|uniref:Short-chain dehydrogenase n=1 Tax=Psychromicrobium lacuslunae TaxID=1618207 RepID=A0A0D4C1I6_9MICC|nr:SDR family NAD(P)-dependent oxidoreductase [Psychromicrobium lacuslunae]AJT42463.1 short-chain dehydrogenase [Psychromicrobium lacuslunae]